jgi:hypothetical protein
MLSSGGREDEFIDQLSHATVDVVADRTGACGVEAGRVVEVVPRFVALPASAMACTAEAALLLGGRPLVEAPRRAARRVLAATGLTLFSPARFC